MAFDLRLLLTKARAVLSRLAPITPIKTDDALVVLIDAALEDATVFGWLKAKAEQPEGTLNLEADPPVALQGALELRGLQWTSVVEVAPHLIAILRILGGF